MKKIGLIDYYLDQYHAENYPHWIEEASQGEFKALYAYAKINAPGGKTNEECAEQMGVELLASIEEVIEKSDCLIVMAPDHPETHEELCQLPLASGKPVYVDKTFAPDIATSKRLLDLAERYKTPMFSSSALRYAKEYRELKKEGIEFINSRGPGRFENYGIHQVEPLVYIMGPTIEKIMYNGTPSTPAFTLRFKDGRAASMSFLGWECDFGLAVNYEDDRAVVIQGTSDFYMQFIDELVNFFRTGKPDASHEEILQVMTVLEYGNLAMQRPDEWVILP